MGFKTALGWGGAASCCWWVPEAAAPPVNKHPSSQPLTFIAALTEKCFSAARMEKKLLQNSSTLSSSEKERLRPFCGTGLAAVLGGSGHNPSSQGFISTVKVQNSMFTAEFRAGIQIQGSVWAAKGKDKNPCWCRGRSWRFGLGCDAV